MRLTVAQHKMIKDLTKQLGLKSMKDTIIESVRRLRDSTEHSRKMLNRWLTIDDA